MTSGLAALFSHMTRFIELPHNFQITMLKQHNNTDQVQAAPKIEKVIVK
jgi:hypothetical protein